MAADLAISGTSFWTTGANVCPEITTYSVVIINKKIPLEIRWLLEHPRPGHRTAANSPASGHANMAHAGSAT
jgi:hypothetical protein